MIFVQVRVQILHKEYEMELLLQYHHPHQLTMNNDKKRESSSAILLAIYLTSHRPIPPISIEPWHTVHKACPCMYLYHNCMYYKLFKLDATITNAE